MQRKQGVKLPMLIFHNIFNIDSYVYCDLIQENSQSEVAQLD